MKYNPDTHNRRSLRLKGYDYTNTGVYFVTVLAHGREPLFGLIEKGEMILNQFGRIVNSEWLRSFEIRKEITIDYYQVMPNHFHAIIWIKVAHEVRASGRSPLQDNREASNDSVPKFRIKPKSLSSLMAGFKSSVTKKINQLRDSSGSPVWHRNFHDRIIRNDKELNAVREYIINNPANWEFDEENPENVMKKEKKIQN